MKFNYQWSVGSFLQHGKLVQSESWLTQNPNQQQNNKQTTLQKANKNIPCAPEATYFRERS